MEFRMELQAEHLSKSYRKKEALKDVNFKLEQGVYGLLGENGANTALRAELLSASGACPATTGAERRPQSANNTHMVFANEEREKFYYEKYFSQIYDWKFGYMTSSRNVCVKAGRQAKV